MPSFCAAVSRNSSSSRVCRRRPRVAERQHPDHRLLALHRQQHHMMNTVLFSCSRSAPTSPRASSPPPGFPGGCEFRFHRSQFARSLAEIPDRPACCVGTRWSPSINWNHAAFAPRPLSVSPARSASWGVILAARNGDGQLVQHRQPARAQPRVVEHDQQMLEPNSTSANR
jgi:hypothetical protein